MSTVVLVVDDEEMTQRLLAKGLQGRGYQVVGVPTGGAALDVLGRQAVDLVLLDYSLPDISGVQLLDKIRALRSDLPVLVVTGFPNVENAVEMMKRGASDYLTKPFTMIDLETRIARALRLCELQAEVSYRRAKNHSENSAFLGQSPTTREVQDLIHDIARYPTATVLIMGQTGTGKSVAARAIHDLTCCGNDAPFVEIDCATIPKDLFESELFGHEKGAFTGAHSAKPGLFEVARNGTAFLDEIGELDPLLQAKLLHVLEERVFKRVGGMTPIKLSARVIAATNRPLLDLVRQQKFREDLYYRLNMFEIKLPKLRDCADDIVPLAQYFMERFNRQYGKSVVVIPEEMTSFFSRYDFPGNVRELRNLIERSVIRSQSDALSLREIQHLLNWKSSEPSTSASAVPSLEPAKEEFPSIAKTERKLVIDAMKSAKGNKTAAAEMLGLSRSALFRRLNKLGLTENAPSDTSPEE